MRVQSNDASGARRWPYLLSAMTAVVAWGISFAVTRAAVREIAPFTLAFLRFALAALLLWPAVCRRGANRIAPSDRWSVFLLGFSGVTLYFAFENFGLKYTTAGHGALIVATIPLSTILMQAVRHRRPPTGAVLLGMAAALLGVFILFGGNGGGANLAGDLLMCGAVLCWVWYTFLAEPLVGRYPDLLLTQRIMAVGAVTLLPPALVEAALRPFSLPSPKAWGGVAFLGIICSAAAYHLWNRAIPVLGVSTTNNLIYIIPLVGVLTGILALGEQATLHVLLGGLLIVGGVALAELRPRGR